MSGMATDIGMGTCCMSGRVQKGQPTGNVEEIAGLNTYVARPEDGSTRRTVILLVEIFGYDLPNIRLMADAYAAAGFMAYVPDVLEGDAIEHSFLQTVEPPLPERESQSVAAKAASTAQTGATLGPWLIRNREAVRRPIIESFINTVRYIPGTDKVGVVGFCWGGRYAILAGQAPFSGQEGKGVDAVFAAHPSLVSIPGDFEEVCVPLGVALGGKDSLLGEKEAGQIKEVVEKKKTGELGVKCEGEVKIYEDQVHGFALRGDWSSEKDKKAMDEAEKQGIEWFKKYLV